MIPETIDEIRRLIRVGAVLIAIAAGAGASAPPAAAAEQAGAAPAQAAAALPESCVPPGLEDRARGLIAEPGFGVALPGAVVFDSIRLDKTEIVYFLLSTTAENANDPRARIVLKPRAEAAEGETTSVSFVVRSQILDDTPEVRRAVATAVASIVARDDGGFYVPCISAVGVRGGEGEAAASSRGLYRTGVIVLLLLAAGIAGRVATRSRERAD